MVFHIDGNSFYASCERVFRPDLRKAPIAVLSNNDGIVVALNAECKALGYKRGDVFFQVKHKMERQGVKVFSSNYALYADMSARMNLIYHRFTPEVEVYSIDESFLFFPDWTNAAVKVDAVNIDAYTAIGADIKRTVMKETGIPVSVGIAPNKTLAKICNKLAKERGGVCNWRELDGGKELAAFPVGDIWGIGRSKAKFLKRHGITTALDLKHYSLHKAAKQLTVTGYRTVRELNGALCIEKTKLKDSQVCMVSRSFQAPVYELDDIITALAEYTQEAVKRIRDENLKCRYITVYLMTNAYAEGDPYFNRQSAQLPYPSCYLPEITAVANELARRIFRPNYKYRKVMIGLTGLERDTRQLDLFDSAQNLSIEKEPLMRAFDKINARHGRGALKLACGLSGKNAAEQNSFNELASWQLKRDYLSPCYTTKIEDAVYAG